MLPALWLDGHLDLAYISQVSGDLANTTGSSGPRSVSLGRLARGRVGIVAATVFIDPTPEARGTPYGYAGSDDWEGANRAAREQVAFYEKLEAAGIARIVRTVDDLNETSRLRLVILMEGADPIRDASDVERWHALGVRMVGLSWALGSRFTGGNARPGPLTSAGREVIAALDAHGIIHDASHLSDEALEGLFAATDRVVVASHSNARALMGPKERHIRDDSAREIARRGGVVGLNLFGKFLAEGRDATLDDALNHVEHIAHAAGTRQVSALGSDLDGGFGPDAVPVGVRHPDEYETLARGLAQRGWSDSEVAGFASNNWLRVLTRYLPSAHR
jgi:membrane dipeptidase